MRLGRAFRRAGAERLCGVGDGTLASKPSPSRAGRRNRQPRHQSRAVREHARIADDGVISEKYRPGLAG